MQFNQMLNMLQFRSYIQLQLSYEVKTHGNRWMYTCLCSVLFVIALLFKFMNMRIVNQTTFFRIQDHFCIDPIKEFWDTKRKEIIRQLQAKQSVVALGKSRFELTLDLTGHLIYVMGKYNHTSMLTFASPT